MRYMIIVKATPSTEAGDLPDPQVGLLLPQWPHRRALQRAESVGEGIRIFLEARERGISTFMVMADAAGVSSGRSRAQQRFALDQKYIPDVQFRQMKGGAGAHAPASDDDDVGG